MFEGFPKRVRTAEEIRRDMKAVGRMPEKLHLTQKSTDATLLYLNERLKAFTTDVYFYRLGKDVYLMRIERNPFENVMSHVGMPCATLDNRYALYLMEIRLREYLDEHYERAKDNEHDWATYVFDGAYGIAKEVSA